MSCGNHHETDCSQVLSEIYTYLDGEEGPVEYQAIRVHLEECAPCLREYGLEEQVRLLVRRCCSDPAPEGLRAKVMLRITEVRAQLD